MSVWLESICKSGVVFSLGCLIVFHLARFLHTRICFSGNELNVVRAVRGRFLSVLGPHRGIYFKCSDATYRQHGLGTRATLRTHLKCNVEGIPLQKLR